jgi:hypothetical protein
MKLLEKYRRPTPIKWRKWGDAILLGTSGLSALTLGSPMTEHQKLWVVFWLECIGVVGKVLTNLAAKK